MPQMPPCYALVQHRLELLSPLGIPTARRMFGDLGLCVDGVALALISA